MVNKKNISLSNRNVQRLLLLVVGLAIFFFFSCAPNYWSKRIDWKEFKFADLPGEKEYPDAGAIILLDEGEMEISLDKKVFQSVFWRHRIIRILNARGHRFANIVIPYNPESQVSQIKARTISPQGKITVVEEDDIFDINIYPNFIFYSDQRAKLFTMPALENGAVIEYSYRLNIPIKTFGHSWSFQSDAPTLISRFTLLEPLGEKINYRIYGIDIEPTVKQLPHGFKSTYVWEARDVPPLKTEYGMPPKNESSARLVLAPLGIKSWDDVGRWYYELSESRIKGGSKIKELASQLTAGVENDEEKLRRIYEWVRDHIRYIAVTIGIGGYQPHPAEEILENRYGDCKDMSTILCSIAREAGLEAHLVLVSTWYNGRADTSLASPYQFNHVIAYCPSVGDSGVWMDATEKGCSFGVLPWYDQNMPVLVVGKDGQAKICITPQVPADSNRTLLDWQVDLQSTGAATIRGTTQLWGAFASELREELYFASPDVRQQWLETYLAKRCSGAKIDSFSIAGLYTVRDPLVISYHFRTATFSAARSDELAFSPADILMFDLADYFRSSARVHPVQFRFGSQTELRLQVNLSDDLLVKTPSLSDSLHSPFGSASWNYTYDNPVFNARITRYLKGEKIPPHQYEDFQKFLDDIDIRNLREVIVVKK